MKHRWLRTALALACVASLLGGEASAKPINLKRRAEYEYVTQLRSHIKHIVVVIQENRSVDNLFHGFPGADTADYGLDHDGRVKLHPVIWRTAPTSIISTKHSCRSTTTGGWTAGTASTRCRARSGFSVCVRSAKRSGAVLGHGRTVHVRRSHVPVEHGADVSRASVFDCRPVAIRGKQSEPNGDDAIRLGLRFAARRARLDDRAGRSRSARAVAMLQFSNARRRRDAARASRGAITRRGSTNWATFGRRSMRSGTSGIRRIGRT